MTRATDQTIVIGAGVGGLASAIRIAARGVPVTLIEARDYPGGKMRTMDSLAGPVDAGPTVLTMRQIFDDLFEAAGTTLDAHVTLRAEPILARHFWPDGTTLDLMSDPEASIEAVRSFSGDRSAREFEKFAARAARLFAAFDAPVMRASAPTFGRLAAHVMRKPSLIRALEPMATLAGSLARQFSDPRLRQLFGRYATYVGGSPYASPAVLALIWHSEAGGVWRIEGGMHRLARAMETVATGLGVHLRYGTTVDRIEVQSGRVAAVRLADGSRLPAARVVFNGDPRALATGLLGPGPAPAVAPQQTEPRSLSANVWTFAATPSGADLAHHNVFFGADPRTEFDPIARGHLPDDPTLYVCAQDRGTGMTPPDIERFEIIMNAPPLPGGLPEDMSSCRIRTFETLRHRGLAFSPEPPDSALTTPSGFDRLFPATAGSLYGRSPHGLTAAFARPTARTRLPGLYLAGGGAHPGAGLPMATLSGRHAAEAILTDLASTSPSPPTAMPGGTSTGSPTMAPAPSRLSPS